MKNVSKAMTVMKRVLLLTLVVMMGMTAVGLIYNLRHTSSFANEAVTDISLPPLPKIIELRAIYLTVGTALGRRLSTLIQFAKTAGVNAFVIDVKDGQKSYLNDDMKQLVRRLRFADLYPIARLPVFQHDGLALAHPELAIKTADGALWRDSGGRRWLDPAGKETWRLILEEAKSAAAMGFGEINLDYIRFPSDGRLERTVYPFWDQKQARTEIINQFARFMRDGLKKDFLDVQLTADVFGYLLLRDDDQGIGQSVTDLAGIFDYLYPMVYPSHYDPGNFNFDRPAAHPYEVVAESLALGRKIFEKHQRPFTNIRPWIQDFDLVGVAYTPAMVRAQMKAIADAGLHQGWLIWNPNNRYRKEIFSHPPSPAAAGVSQ